MSPLRVIYAGTPEFAVPALQAIQASEHQLVAVLTQPDRPAGRGRRLQASPIKLVAQSSAIPVWQPHTLKDEQICTSLQQLEADLMIVTAYGLLLPRRVLDIPRYGCWNIHASLLPRWRGAAPIQRAIEAGDETTGITIMQMDIGLDTGDMLMQSECPITANDTSATLHDHLAQLGAKNLMECIQSLANGQPKIGIPQNDEHACYAHRLDKKEAEVNWSEPADIIALKVRAFNPWPVSWTILAGKRTRIWEAKPIEGQFGSPGDLHSNQSHPLIIACGTNGLAVDALQPEGSRVIAAKDWLNANASLITSTAL